MLAFKRKRGRPPGAKNKHTPVWQPKKWKVDHEVAVMMHIAGKTNIEIGLAFGKNPLWVGMVINSDRGQKVIEKVRNNLPTRSIEESYSQILEKATKRLKDFLDNDTAFTNSPIMSVNAAMKAMEMIDSRLKTNPIQTNNTLVLTSESKLDTVLDALRTSKEVTDKHRLKLING